MFTCKKILSYLHFWSTFFLLNVFLHKLIQFCMFTEIPLTFTFLAFKMQSSRKAVSANIPRMLIPFLSHSISPKWTNHKYSLFTADVSKTKGKLSPFFYSSNQKRTWANKLIFTCLNQNFTGNLNLEAEEKLASEKPWSGEKESISVLKWHCLPTSSRPSKAFKLTIQMVSILAIYRN